ncbi:serine hydrolase [Myxococcota bacterium]|nr:serine hydrolase [Myxococcota bacterium]
MARASRSIAQAPFVALGALIAALVACGGETSAPAGTLPPTDVELGVLPDSPAGRRLAWVIEKLNEGGLTAAQVESAFTPELLAGFSADRLSAALTQLSDELRPIEVHHVVGTPEAHRVTAAILSRGADWYSIKVVTSVDAPYLIAGIHYQVDEAVAPPPPSDWSRFEEAAVAVAPRTSFLVAEVGTECRAIAARDAAVTSPIASAFKLWVLDALVDEIDAGNHAWTETLAIDDAHKSLPSGYLHLETAGSTLTLAQFATAMIEDSDNTAADHLIGLLGRERVEAQLGAAGHASAAKNRPLLTTRELFLLKLWASPEARDAWVAGDEATRRAYLEGPLASVDVFSLEAPWRAWKAPIALDTVEWFASHEDLCRVMTRLRDAMGRPAGPTLRGVLSKNTVFPFNPERWSWAGFKGGSEPGLLNVTYLMEREDGRWFFVGITASDPSAAIAQGSVVRAARDAVALLADE